MRFNNAGLVTFESRDSYAYIPWTIIHALWHWLYVEEKNPSLFPRHKFNREQVAFILAHYPDEVTNFETFYQEIMDCDYPSVKS